MEIRNQLKDCLNTNDLKKVKLTKKSGMEVRFAEVNDRRAVWLWTQDEYFKLFLKNQNLMGYEQYKTEFDNLLNKRCIASTFRREY